jgi:hypothetical protein
MSNAHTSLLDVASDDSTGTLTYSLEVRGGRTGFRRRPILGDRFLIGSDAICDLRLDGRLAAPLHCLIHRDGDLLEAEGIGGAPIVLNGAVVEAAQIAAGDTLGIGGVRLVVHAVAVRFDVIRPGDEIEFDNAVASAPSRTAAQLVELIEEERERLREFHDRRRAGADALLDAVRRSRRPALGAAVERTPLVILERLVRQLDEVAGIVAERNPNDEIRGDAQKAFLALAERFSNLAATIGEQPERPSDRAA